MSGTVSAAVHQLLLEHDVRHVFGNPGSTELPFLIGLGTDIKYVLGLQESVVTAMADGYAQASGRPALVNLHTAPGLGNAAGALFTAQKNKTPLVVTAGQQDTRHLAWEPLLSGPLVEMAAPYVKWATQPTSPSDVPDAFARAFQIAGTPPTGPVFISIPINFWDAEAEAPPVRRVTAPGAAPPGALDRLARALAAAQNPAMVAGAGIDRAGAWDNAVALAEHLGLPVYEEPLAPRRGFPSGHPLFRGVLKPAVPMVSQDLAGYDLILVVGAPVFTYYPYYPGPQVPPGADIYLLTDDPADAARAPVKEAFVGDLGGALSYLVTHVAARPPTTFPSRASEVARRRSEAARGRDRMTPAYIFNTLAAKLPEDSIIVDESITASPTLRDYLPVHRPASYFTAASGALGWAMPAAVGIKLAQPERPVVAIVGDGSAMYSIQALWTAAQWQTPVLFIVLNNGQYAILKSYTQAFYPGTLSQVQGLNLPGLDLCGLAGAMGVAAERVSSPDALGPAFERGLAGGGPYLVEVMSDRTVPALF